MENPAAFLEEMTKMLFEKQNHPLITQMLQTAQVGDPPPAESATSSSDTHGQYNASGTVQFQQSLLTTSGTHNAL